MSLVIITVLAVDVAVNQNVNYSSASSPGLRPGWTSVIRLECHSEVSPLVERSFGCQPL